MKGIFSLLFIVVSVVALAKCQEDDRDEFLNGTFPPTFLWGVATSAYQIEGAIDVDGKGVNIWDVYAHANDGGNILDGSNGDIASQSYYKIAEDVKLLKDMGADFYRFSISWTRIFPNGSATDEPNAAGIDYYNRLIDALLADGIKPLVTIYCWDLPQALEDIGGWPSEELIPSYVHFATTMFREFGDRVKDWITFNEPWIICMMGYGYGEMAPGIKEPAELPYKCGHTILKSHGMAYRVYETDFKPTQGGQVGIVLSSDWNEPLTPGHPEHIAAVKRKQMFNVGWFSDPLYRGDYPLVMRELIAEKSQNEGRNISRLPVFDEAWKQIINGTLDFIGINHYTSTLVYPTLGGSPGIEGDSNTGEQYDDSWEDTVAPWLKVVPWGLRRLANWVTEEYNRPPIYITENGYPDMQADGLDDTKRTEYFRLYINELMKAVVIDGSDVRGYTAWSLMDNFEWGYGYTQRFGIHYINFSDPDLVRVPKQSAIFLTKVFEENGFPNGP